ncbi:UDP-N-acetylglucosamine 1-carboxyvinyltransferase [Candidatus Woesebacteria bacterium]|nr:UDP-N-acetylglucosamine 1-carboxyvinyltransferase [Candidatus Woesebacteria bacterium]
MNTGGAFHITGGKPLVGSVRLGGAKNASYKLMIAALLADSESRLLNFSRISDVETVAKVIETLGGGIRRAGERALFIAPETLNSSTVPDDVGEQGRFSTLFIPVLLARFKHALVPKPGGDKIGARPLERHFEGLVKLGAQIQERGSMIEARCEQLVGTTYRFEKNTHTGTETLILAATMAVGKTILENAAEEPEVDDLIEFINEMGGHIRRRPGRIIEIQGVSELHGSIHQIMPDRNEAVSYGCAALATKGDIVIENAKAEHLEAFIEKVREVGGGFEVGKYGTRFYYKGPLQATDITTQIHPGFMTDWQPLFTTVLTQCEGESLLHETIMPRRFQHITALQEMGASIEYVSLDVAFPEKVYNFNLDDDHEGDFHAVKITGATPLHAADCAIHDLRQGATLILAALAAKGTSTLTGIGHIDRGYEDLSDRLVSLGAQLERQEL